MARNHPPFTIVILEGDLIPSPTKVGDTLRYIWPDGVEPFSIKLMDELVISGAADDAKSSALICKDRSDYRIRKTISVTERSESMAGQLHRSVPCYPEIT